MLVSYYAIELNFLLSYRSSSSFKDTFILFQNFIFLSQDFMVLIQPQNIPFIHRDFHALILKHHFHVTFLLFSFAVTKTKMMTIHVQRVVLTKNPSTMKTWRMVSKAPPVLTSMLPNRRSKPARNARTLH